jgi:hypothetical protein
VLQLGEHSVRLEQHQPVLAPTDRGRFSRIHRVSVNLCVMDAATFQAMLEGEAWDPPEWRAQWRSAP